MRRLLAATKLDRRPLIQKLADEYYDNVFAPAMECYFTLDVRKYKTPAEADVMQKQSNTNNHNRSMPHGKNK